MSEIKELKSKHTYVCLKLSEIEKRREDTGKRISKLMKKREDAWQNLIEAEEALKEETQKILFEINPIYKKAYEQHMYFRSKYEIKNKQLEDSIALEELFIVECNKEYKNAKESGGDTEYWADCKNAHANRLNLLEEERRRLALYIEKSEEKLYEIEQNAIYDMVSNHKDNSERRQIKKAGVEDANRAFNAAEGLLGEARKTLKTIFVEYGQTETEAAKLKHKIDKLEAESL